MTSDNAVNGTSFSEKGEVLGILRKCGRPNSIFGPEEKDAGMRSRMEDTLLRYYEMTQNSKPLCAGIQLKRIFSRLWVLDCIRNDIANTVLPVTYQRLVRGQSRLRTCHFPWFWRQDDRLMAAGSLKTIEEPNLLSWRDSWVRRNRLETLDKQNSAPLAHGERHLDLSTGS